MVLVPLAFTAILLALSLLPRIQLNSALAWSFWAAAGVLALWNVAVALRPGRPPGFLKVTPRAQHYVQSLCQFGVYAYWGWFWPPVYDYVPLLAGQLAFAYAFDILLAWTRGEKYAIG